MTANNIKGTWPFTEPEVVVKCWKWPLISVKSKDSDWYALNGYSQNKFKALKPENPLWRNDPKLGQYGLKVNIGPVLDFAKSLCD